MNLDQVLAQLFVGSYPLRTTDIDRLKQDFGITAVLNLHTDDDINNLNLAWAALEDHYRDSAIEVCRVPVRDFDSEDLRRKLPDCVEALNQLLEDGHIVYVHCTAGMGRSPSVAIAYLHWVEKRDLDEAVRYVKKRRPCACPDVEAIRLAGDGFGMSEENA